MRDATSQMAEAAAPLVLAWSQGEKNGTVTVEQGTKAGGLQACLNAETCEANVQAGLKIYVRIGTSVLSMKKPLGVVIDSGDPVVEAHWKIFIDPPQQVVAAPTT